MADGIRALKGELLWAPEALELSMNWCGFDCSYCFANARKPNRNVDLPQIMNLLANFRDRSSREAKLLQMGYPMVVSNHVDVFSGTNAKQFEPIWEVCVSQAVPIVWQTRGAHKPQRLILDRIIRETPRSIWYISIPMWDDEIRKRIEPRAPSIESRLDLIAQLKDAGHSVVVGINPTCVEWLPDYEPLIDRIIDLGVFGVWFSALYFGPTFKGQLTPEKISRLTPGLIDRAGCNGSPIDHAHIKNASEYAKAAGLGVYHSASDEPTEIFEKWDEVYKKKMPMIQELINAASKWHKDEGGEYIDFTKSEAISAMSTLPEGFDYGPFFHLDVKEFRLMQGLSQNQPLPSLDASSFWTALWNSEYFSAKMGPLSCNCFAYASIKENGLIMPIRDKNNDKIMVYRPAGFRYRYVHTPELAK